MKLLHSCSFVGIGAGFLLRLLTGLAVHFWGLGACMAWSFFLVGFCCIVSPASVHESFRWKAHEMGKILGLRLRRSSGELALSCWGVGEERRGM